MARLFFATNIHGSEVCWRKFLNAPAFYGVGVLFLGGDMTGKALVPTVRDGARYEVTLQEHRYVLEPEDEIRQMEERIAARGYYPVRLGQDDVAALQADPARVDQLSTVRMRDTLGRWMALTEEKLGGKDICCYVCPGNDDREDIGEIIAQPAGAL